MTTWRLGGNQVAAKRLGILFLGQACDWVGMWVDFWDVHPKWADATSL